MALDNIELVALNPANMDSDNDGINDGIDQCPNTPTNETANTHGCSPSQVDTDGDGVFDNNDTFPSDPNEWLDTDADGTGNNADTDDDNDGVLDVNDAFPLDASESLDTDGDLMGNNADTDDDNDSVLDINDTYPLISLAGRLDTDGNGIPNECDAACINLGMSADNDDDNDGVLDINDAFPLDASEWLDTDGDALGNNVDTDDDNDGVLDANDSYPLIGLGGRTDTDGDGTPNDCNATCQSLGMVADTDDDNDGVLDIYDAFPTNPNEAQDTDGDSIGNNADVDDDGDGVLDIYDAYPLISLGGRLDTDNDGLPNDCDASCIAVGLTADSDDDGDTVSDVDEISNGTNPLLVDTDTDGWDDGIELACASNGNDISSLPVDTDTDAVCDYLDADADGNGLIDITTLDDLYNIRNHPGAAAGLGCDGCNGFELLNDLDFDENQDGIVDANDHQGKFWNNGEGWLPLTIGDSDTDGVVNSDIVFEGNGFTIKNLFIHSQDDKNLGLFGRVNSKVTIRNLNLHGSIKKSSVFSYTSIGLLAGYYNGNSAKISNVHLSGSIDAATG